MEQQEIITKLIKDDLTNNKLIVGLNNLGLESDIYHLYLSEVIFEMIGIKLNNANFNSVYNHYDKLTKTARQIDLKLRDGAMDRLAIDVYDKLCKLRDKLEKERGDN